MIQPSKPPVPSPPGAAVPSWSPAPELRNPLIEDYLDHVFAPLVGTVPFATREELRGEWRSHLEALAEAYAEIENDPDEAVRRALRQFGEPDSCSRQWLREWQQGDPATPWPAMRLALTTFGNASVPLLAILTGVTGGRMDAGPIPGAFEVLTLFVVPVVAGFLTGLRVHGRHALGTFYALAWLSAVTALLSQVPALETPFGLMSIAEGFAWIPLGCAAAALGGRFRRLLRERPQRWALD